MGLLSNPIDIWCPARSTTAPAPPLLFLPSRAVSRHASALGGTLVLGVARPVAVRRTGAENDIIIEGLAVSFIKYFQLKMFCRT